MSIESLYHFFFESFAGVGILVLAGLVISVLVCVIMEWRTRQAFKDRGEVEDDDDDFTFFDDDDDEDYDDGEYDEDDEEDDYDEDDEDYDDED